MIKRGGTILSADRGYLYQCEGDWWAHQTYYSILSIRKYGRKCANYPVVVYTRTDSPHVERIKKLNRVTVIKPEKLSDDFTTHDRLLRIRLLQSMPFNITLRIDSDTLVLKDPTFYFEKAKHHGVGIVKNLMTPTEENLHGKIEPYYNCGIIAWRKDTANEVFRRVNSLLNKYKKKDYKLWDQHFVNAAIHDMKLGDIKLPIAYNQPNRSNQNTVIQHWYGESRGRLLLNKQINNHYTRIKEPKRRADDFILLYGMQSSGSSLLSLFCAQDSRYAIMMDWWNEIDPPRFYIDKPMIFKMTVNNEIPFSRILSILKPTKKVLCLRNPIHNYISIEKKNYEGSVDEKFRALEYAYKNHKFDCIIKYEDFVRKRLGDLPRYVAINNNYRFPRILAQIRQFTNKHIVGLIDGGAPGNIHRNKLKKLKAIEYKYDESVVKKVKKLCPSICRLYKL